MKRFLCLRSIPIVLLMLVGTIVLPCPLQAQCVPPPGGMVAWWPLDETTGPTANDIAGPVNDSGTWVNNPVAVDGKVAAALSFDGSSYVEVAEDDLLDFGTGDFSVDFWIKTTDSIWTRTILDNRSQGGSAPIGYTVYLYDGRLGWQIADGSGYINWVTTEFIADGLWHHAAVSIDRDQPDGMKGYVDGFSVEAAGDPTPCQGSLTNDAPLIIAGSLLSPSYGFVGVLDEIELLNRVLDSAEIESIWAADSSGKCKDRATFIGHFMTPEGDPWPFDVTISDGEWVQEFDSVTYIETEVPLNATYTFSYVYYYGSYDHAEMGHVELTFAPGDVREFEVYAIDPEQVEECIQPYVWLREYGAGDTLTWDWNAVENRLTCDLVAEAGHYVGYKVWGDVDTLAPIDRHIAAVSTSGSKDIVIVISKSDDESTFYYVVKVKHPTVNIDVTVQSAGTSSGSIIELADADIDNVAFGIRNATHNRASIDTYGSALHRLDGTPVAAEYIYPQYSVPPPLGSFRMAIEDLPEEYVAFDMPIHLVHDKPQTLDVYPPKLAELQLDTFMVVAEGVFSNSTYSDFWQYGGDSISVNVSTENTRDWWGCFVLPDSQTAALLLAYSSTGAIDTLQESDDWLDNQWAGNNLITVRIGSSIERLVLVPGPMSCCTIRADVNHDGSGPDIADLVYLVTYMFGGGAAPPCLAEADINGDGSGPDIADLVYLVTYMFQGGPDPVPCD